MAEWKQVNQELDPDWIEYVLALPKSGKTLRVWYDEDNDNWAAAALGRWVDPAPTLEEAQVKCERYARELLTLWLEAMPGGK